MSPFIIGNIQFTLSLIVYACIAVWYVYPALRKLDWHKAIVPLLLVHTFRYGPLTLLMPGQVSADVPADVARTIAYGDLMSGILAIIAAIAVWYRVAVARVLVWVFTIIGFGDVVVASVRGIGAGLLDMHMGFNLYILNFYVPALIVTHIMIVILLLRKP
jgi:hypothetical protein